MRKKILLLFLLIPGILFLSCEKQDDTAIDPLTLDKWITYSTSTGLAGNQVWDIMIDKDDNVWFATDNGVSKYDGSNWRTYRTRDGLIHNTVYAIEQDRFGDIWIGTAEGFSIYDGTEFLNYTGTNQNLWEVNSMFQASNGSFWVGTNGHGTYEFTSEGIYTYYWEDITNLNYAFDIVEDKSKNIWVSTYAGVIRGNAAGLKLFTTQDGLATNQIRSLLADSWDYIWIGTFDAENLNRYNNGKIEDISLNNGFPTTHVMSMMEDSRGNVWLGTLTVGVTKYDGAVMRTYLTGDGLASDRILSLAEDSSGNLWFGTFDEGVTRYTPGMD
ncbi:two-component regulator propeller domain-containing protein [Bacteroidota bacterium]